MRYRKRPIEVDAIQWDWANFDEIVDWSEGNVRSAKPWKPDYPVLVVTTLHGEADVCTNDWVVRGPSGDYWPVKPDIFAETYELVSDG